MKKFYITFLFLLHLNLHAEEQLEKNLTPNYKNINLLNYGTPSLFLAYGLARWEWGKTHGFAFRDERWYQKNTYAGGADKASHLYFSFLVDRMAHSYYMQNGLSSAESLRQSVLLSAGIGVLIEVGDGFSHYGFSYSDLLSDLLGAGIADLLNRNPFFDEIFGLQFAFFKEAPPSTYKKENIYNQVADYNHQKYLINFRLAGVPKIKDIKSLRYINFDFGYYTRGYGTFRSIEVQPNRKFYSGISINLTQILKDYFPQSDFAIGTGNFFKYYQAPYLHYN